MNSWHISAYIYPVPDFIMSPSPTGPGNRLLDGDPVQHFKIGVTISSIFSFLFYIFNGLFESCELGLVRRLRCSRLWRMGSCRLWPLILEQKYNPQRRAGPHQSKKQPPMRFLQRFLVSFKNHEHFYTVKASRGHNFFHLIGTLFL